MVAGRIDHPCRCQRSALRVSQLIYQKGHIYATLILHTPNKRVKITCMLTNLIGIKGYGTARNGAAGSENERYERAEGIRGRLLRTP